MQCFKVFFWSVIMNYRKVDIRQLTFKHEVGNIRHIETLSADINEQILS